MIKQKIEAGVYKSSNSSYHSQRFAVLKKDGESLRIVHSLEPLNKVTIAHSGLPAATEELASHFAGCACGGIFDLYIGYDERVLDVRSRDYTTFQTPFGALRLVTLSMGWTNSVPIFHDDITFILKDEIPHVTWPYIDDVPVRGPPHRYELPDGSCEVIPENPGIRRFVWEHLHNVNRVLQRIKYAGGTFSGKKSVVCADEIVVVGHRCSYEGQKPETKRLAVVMGWGDCHDKSDVRAFLETCGTFRMFIKDYAKVAAPINRLTQNNIPFVWGEEQRIAMAEMKRLLAESAPLKPIDYESEGAVVLSVDTSWMAVGFGVFQEKARDPKQRTCAKLGTITMNER